MANFQGGKLFLGIEDDGSIISVILKAQLNLRNGIELSRSW